MGEGHAQSSIVNVDTSGEQLLALAGDHALDLVGESDNGSGSGRTGCTALVGKGGKGRIGERGDAADRNEDRLHGESGDRTVYVGERSNGGISRYERVGSYVGNAGGGVCSRLDRRKVPKDDERLKIDCRHERFFSTFCLSLIVGVLVNGDSGDTGEIGLFASSPYIDGIGGTAGRGLEGGGCGGGPCLLTLLRRPFEPFPSAHRRRCKISRRV